jgi:16S rRNA (cytosine1402-N4)-methyltransferase
MHQPVLYHETINALQPKPGGRYVDGTLGAGGHAWGILEASTPGGKLLGLDLDPQALKVAHERLAQFGDRAILIRASYVTMRTQLTSQGWNAVDGIVLDFGVSSMQLDAPERGFSFRFNAPLDMRFDPQGETNAADLVNNLSEAELADLIYRFGEERRSRKVAHAIVQARPIHTTEQLAKVVAKSTKFERSGVHPATKTFQALRIAVNKELDAIEQVLPEAVSSLTSGGRIAVICFHSLEDRIVKDFFRQASRNCICPPKQPICTCNHVSTIENISRKAIKPSAAERLKNPRARSARLRVAEKK